MSCARVRDTQGPVTRYLGRDTQVENQLQGKQGDWLQSVDCGQKDICEIDLLVAAMREDCHEHGGAQKLKCQMNNGRLKAANTPY